MEWLNLLSVSWFLFFLLILLVGYFTVEVVLGKHYPFAHIILKYNQSIFDRTIHYIAWGITVEVIFFVMLSLRWGKGLDLFIKTFNDMGAIWKLFPEWMWASVQLVITSLNYFFCLLVSLMILSIGFRLPAWIENISIRYRIFSPKKRKK